MNKVKFLKQFVVVKYSGNMQPDCKTTQYDEAEILESFDSESHADEYASSCLRDSILDFWSGLGEYRTKQYSEHSEKELDEIMENHYYNEPDTAEFTVFEKDEIFSLEEDEEEN